MILTTESIVTDIPEKKDENANQAANMGGGMY